MKIGIEIETIYSRQQVGTIQEGPYADGFPFSIADDTAPPVPTPGAFGQIFNRHPINIENPKWTVQRDSSLDAYTGDGYSRPSSWMPRAVELVSGIDNGKDEFIETLNELKSMMTWKKPSAELKDIMFFNKSCGCHIHFTFDDLDINKICGYSPLVRVRKTFFDGLDSLDVRQELKNTIKQQYFRRYSKKLVKNAWKNNHGGERNTEFNFRSFDNNKGFEWRAFNLKGVQTWEEFFKILILGYDSANSLRKHTKKFTDNEHYNVGSHIKRSIMDKNAVQQYNTRVKYYKKPINVSIIISGIGKKRCNGTGELNEMYRRHQGSLYMRDTLSFARSLRTLNEYGMVEEREIEVLEHPITRSAVTAHFMDDRAPCEVAIPHRFPDDEHDMEDDMEDDD